MLTDWMQGFGGRDISTCIRGFAIICIGTLWASAAIPAQPRNAWVGIVGVQWHVAAHGYNALEDQSRGPPIAPAMGGRSKLLRKSGCAVHSILQGQHGRRAARCLHSDRRLHSSHCTECIARTASQLVFHSESDSAIRQRVIRVAREIFGTIWVVPHVWTEHLHKWWHMRPFYIFQDNECFQALLIGNFDSRDKNDTLLR